MRRVDSVPKYCRHKASGRAYVTLGGKMIYLGMHGSAASREAYERLVAEWLASGRSGEVRDGGPTVIQLVAAFRRHARAYYRDASGEVSRHVSNFDDALKPLVKLYGRTPAAEFGPLSLKVVRQAMIEAGLCRTNINRRVNRIRSVFKWAVENELVPPSVLHGLMAVSGLRLGRCGVRESEPVKPVPEAHVEAVKPFVSRQVWAMIELQRLTGCRPGEIVLMRGCDLDTTGELWVYRPAHHKTAIHGHTREIYLGPRARKIVESFLKPDTNAYLFSPRDAEQERRERLHAERKTPLSCGNKPGSNRRRKPKREPGDHYTTNTYARAIDYACRKAGIDSWGPNRLRHSRATELRERYGLEAAAVLGHAKVETTQIYAERQATTAARIAAEVG